jgi:hypothetical protein
MNSDLYLKFYITQAQTIINTCLYTDLSQIEFKYLIAAWIYSTYSKTIDNNIDTFCSYDLVPILKLINTGHTYPDRTFRNVKIKSLTKKGYLEFVFAKAIKGSSKNYYKLNYQKMYELMDVLIIFHHAYEKKYKQLGGIFGSKQIKSRTYYKIRRDVLQHINKLR